MTVVESGDPQLGQGALQAGDDPLVEVPEGLAARHPVPKLRDRPEVRIDPGVLDLLDRAALPLIGIADLVGPIVDNRIHPGGFTDRSCGLPGPVHR